MAQVFSAELARRGDRMLRDSELVRCESCAGVFRERCTARMNAQASELAAALRVLRSACTPEQERDAAATVKRLHSAPTEALAAISEAKRSKPAARISAAQIAAQRGRG